MQNSVYGGSKNPIEGIVGGFIFLLLVLIGAVIAFISCSETIEWSVVTRDTITQIYCLSIVCSWFCFTISEDEEDFGLSLIVAVLLVGTFVTLFLYFYPILFWFSLVAIIVCGISYFLYVNSEFNRINKNFLRAKEKEELRRKRWDKKFGGTIPIKNVDDSEHENENEHTKTKVGEFSERTLELQRRLDWDKKSVFKLLEPRLSRWEVFSNCLFIAWIISGIFVTMWHFIFLPHSGAVLEVSWISFYVDVRYLITGLLLVIFVGEAIVETYYYGTPEIPSLPKFKIPRNENNVNSQINAIIEPFIIVINAILSAVQIIANVIWLIIAMVFLYLFLFGVQLADKFIKILFEKQMWLTVIKVLSTFAIILVIWVISVFASAEFKIYLINEAGTFINVNQVYVIIPLSIAFIFVNLLIIFIHIIWGKGTKLLGKTVWAGIMISFSWTISGCIIYVLNYFNKFKIVGFNTIGIYSLFVMIIVGLGLIFGLGLWIKDIKSKQT
jgi:hypothetical protein